jgi:hypothetical protein
MVGLLDLAGEVARGDAVAVGVAGDLARDVHVAGAGGDRHVPVHVGGGLRQPLGVQQGDGHDVFSVQLVVWCGMLLPTPVGSCRIAAEEVILSFSDIMPNRSYSLAKGASGRSFEEPSIWRRTSTSSAR